eukprot:EC722982.1.p2 GENE.EC722982.1~~EC722982.1.p2  ORF type:complete len:64 (+),score=8.14 EC722982.1:201-392(+)
MVASALKSAFPGLEVLGNSQATRPRLGAFEVTTEDGQVLFSKLKTGRFPDPKEVVAALAAGSA